MRDQVFREQFQFLSNGLFIRIWHGGVELMELFCRDASHASLNFAHIALYYHLDNLSAQAACYAALQLFVKMLIIGSIFFYKLTQIFL